MEVQRVNGAERVAALSARLGVTFARVELALTAITHKSWVNEHKGEGATDNERLEFLGDAVVDLVIAHRLMERFPEAPEGELSKLRALLVNEDGLARVARALGLGELLLLGRGEELSGGREKASVLADALEAVIGALYLGDGLAAAAAFVDAHFAEALAGVASGRSGIDWKTRLQEEVQLRHRITPRYRVVSETGPAHERVFEVEVGLGGAPYGRASGRSKKEAEQAAARATLAQLEAEGQGAAPAAPAPPAPPSPGEPPEGGGG